VKAALDKRPDEVAAMFDGVARRYDVTNSVLSAGLDGRWRKLTQEVLELTAGDRGTYRSRTSAFTVPYAVSGFGAMPSVNAARMRRLKSGRG
jgi:demethylmenaquinone methyltransferase/2-methoxy-6-polyprenyl-1,4-benzoquinol methylase